MIKKCWVFEGRVPMASGLSGWAAWRSVKALLAERQMATNMLSRLGKHWQLHPKGLSPCQLEDISVLQVPQSRDKNMSKCGQHLFFFKY